MPRKIREIHGTDAETEMGRSPEKAGGRSESTLPQWAQETLAQLRQRLDEATTRLADRDAGYPDSPVSYFDGTRNTMTALPPNVTVRIAFGTRRENGERRHFAEMRLNDDGFAVQVYTSDSMVIKSQSSNVISLDVDDRYELRDDAGIRNMGQNILEKAKLYDLNFNDIHELMDGAPPTRKEIEQLGRVGRTRRREGK